MQTMETATATPKVGQMVLVRQRRYLVEGVEPGLTPEEATRVAMACVDDDAQGQELEVLWEHEVDAEVLTGEAWDSLASKGFDAPDRFSSYLHTLRWNCVTATDPKLFQAPFRAGIQVNAYQLEPLRKALLLPRVNLFIADDVGLGKTIEAGLIARELLLRRKVRDIVVACPPSMITQWKDELEQRFGLTFEVLDKAYVTRMRQERGFGVNPWHTHSRFIISHRLLIDEGYAGPLRDWLGEMRPGCLLILDEAHHAAPSSGAKYAIDSKITKAIRDLAGRFEHRIFLSATPHNGHSNSFSALLEILDPQRFCRGVKPSPKLRNEVMVRRLKEDLREVAGGFAKRVVVQEDIDGLPADAPELRLAALLNDYRVCREKRLQASDKRIQATSGLLIIGLQQRLLSSIEAFWKTLRRHREMVDRQAPDILKGLSALPAAEPQVPLLVDGVDADDDQAEWDESAVEAEELAEVERVTKASQVGASTPEAVKLFERERGLLQEMADLADAHRAAPDARVRKLIDWIKKEMCPDLEGKPGAKWNDTRVLIFTEYEDTRRYLQRQLENAIEETDKAKSRIMVLSGATPGPVRDDIKQAFNADPKRHPVRILLATDAAREGLNFQSHCWHLFHLDVPWNPGRMEQRNGRIDRKLQPKPEVFCHYFFYKQRPEDRILQVLVRKTETIKKELGSLSKVVEGRLGVLLKQGIRRERLDALADQIEGARPDAETEKLVQEELEEARDRQDDLRKQIDVLRTQLERAEEHIGMDEAHFRAAITCSLEMMGAPGLKVLSPNPDDWSSPLPRFAFPRLDQLEGADAYRWANTIDGLRPPRPRDAKLSEWRRDAPVRPVIFEDPGTMDDRAVHLHLEHRVVQRLLARFTAQGFVFHDLSRACLTQTKDAIPRVVLIGRLCLYGPHAARLHEELIPITARWLGPAERKGALKPYGREAEGKTMDLLEAALGTPATRPIPEPVLHQLQASAPNDIRDLLAHLEERAAEYARDAVAQLERRGAAEAKSMQGILEDQRERIGDESRRRAVQGVALGLDTDELRQLEANKKHWDKRLKAIELELKSEPQRIRELYEVKAQRVEPVGLAYLWPVTG
jgi:hypothetical protein